jgi:hypothetical protein
VSRDACDRCAHYPHIGGYRLLRPERLFPACRSVLNSRSNVCILLTGPTNFLMGGIVQAVGDYIGGVVTHGFRTFTFMDDRVSSWFQSWTLTYRRYDGASTAAVSSRKAESPVRLV